MVRGGVGSSAVGVFPSGSGDLAGDLQGLRSPPLFQPSQAFEPPFSGSAIEGKNVAKGPISAPMVNEMTFGCGDEKVSTEGLQPVGRAILR